MGRMNRVWWGSVTLCCKKNRPVLFKVFENLSRASSNCSQRVFTDVNREVGLFIDFFIKPLDERATACKKESPFKNV